MVVGSGCFLLDDEQTVGNLALLDSEAFNCRLGVGRDLAHLAFGLRLGGENFELLFDIVEGFGDQLDIADAA